MRGSAVFVDSDAVDLYDTSSGLWTTAQLSIRRSFLSGTSVGDLALFAGGYIFSMYCRAGHAIKC